MKLPPYRMQPEAPDVWTVRLAGGELVGWFRTEARARQVLDLLSGRAPAFGEAAAAPAQRIDEGGEEGDDDAGRCGLCGGRFALNGAPADRCPEHRHEAHRGPA